MLVVNGIGIAGSLLDAAVDRVVRHVVGLCLRDNVLQLTVVVRIRTAFLNGNGDFSSETGKHFTLCGVVLFFLVFNVGKFGMS